MNGKEIKDGPLAEWYTLRGNALADKKSAFLTQATVPSPTAAFMNFKKWTEALIALFVKGQAAQLVNKVDSGAPGRKFGNSTLGGHIIFILFNVIETAISDI